MNKYVSYRNFTIRIKLLNAEKREYHIEVFPIDKGPSIWGNDFGNPNNLIRKFKREIDRYWEKPEGERKVLD